MLIPPSHWAIPVKERTDKDVQNYPPQTSQEHSNFLDGSGPLFSMYLRIAKEQDQSTAKLLKADTDQTLIFCGLFSATVAALAVESMQDLKHSAEEVRWNAVLVNSLWLLSLLISLTCALMAMSLHQWARRHEKVTPQRYNLCEQARMRAFFATGIDSRNFHFMVGIIPVLVHLSMFLFFLGFLVRVFRVHPTIFVISCCWILLSLVTYGYATVLPFFRPDSPIHTPLSNFVASAYTGGLEHSHSSHVGLGMMKLAEDKAQESSLQLDSDVLKRTFNALKGDHDLEEFFEAIPGFCNSEVAHNPLISLDRLGRHRLAESLIGFWDRTLSSNLVPESVKTRRLILCVEAIKAANLGIAAPQILDTIFSRSVGVISLSEIGHSLGKLRDSNVASRARAIIAGIISNTERDHHWSMLAMDELGVSEDVFKNYLVHGDSVLLANLIHITRHLFDSLREGHQDLARESLCILPSVSKFNILNTLPELQHEFCNLWNLVIQQAQDGGADDNPFIEILIQIRHHYIPLHRANATPSGIFASTADNDYVLHEPASYPLCEIADHLLNSAPLMPEGAVSTPSSASQSPTTTSSTSPVPELPPTHVIVPQAGIPQDGPSSAVAMSSYPTPPSPSQSLPTITPSTGSVVTPSVADTSLDSSMAISIFSSPSGTSDLPRPDEGTTGNQAKLTHQGPSYLPAADIATDDLRTRNGDSSQNPV